MDKLTEDLLEQSYEDDVEKKELLLLKNSFKINADLIMAYLLSLNLSEIKDKTELRRFSAEICFHVIKKIGNIMEPCLPAMAEMLKSLEFAYTKSEKTPVEIEMYVGKLLKGLVIFLELDDPEQLAKAFKNIADEHKDKWN